MWVRRPPATVCSETDATVAVVVHETPPFVERYAPTAVSEALDTGTTTVPPPTAAHASIDVLTVSDDLKFTPASQDAQVGDVVQWSNSGSVMHTVTFDDFASLSDVSLQGGATWEVKFAAAGTYAYHCTVHPTMTGTINLLDGSTIVFYFGLR